MSDDPRHSLGRRGEQLAAEHLERLGYRVVARNYRTRFGELDLVATDDYVLVFCEVKTRRLARATRGRTSGRRSAARSGAWARSGSPRSTTGRAPPSCGSTRSGSGIDRDGALVSLDHLQGAF